MARNTKNNLLKSKPWSVGCHEVPALDSTPAMTGAAQSTRVDGRGADLLANLTEAMMESAPAHYDLQIATLELIAWRIANSSQALELKQAGKKTPPNAVDSGNDLLSLDSMRKYADLKLNWIHQIIEQLKARNARKLSPTDLDSLGQRMLKEADGVIEQSLKQFRKDGLVIDLGAEINGPDFHTAWRNAIRGLMMLTGPKA